VLNTVAIAAINRKAKVHVMQVEYQNRIKKIFFRSDETAVQSYIYFFQFFQFFSLCDDVPMYPWQPLVIEYDFFASIMKRLPPTKFEVFSIS